jgi:hypothetical protein
MDTQDTIEICLSCNKRTIIIRSSGFWIKYSGLDYFVTILHGLPLIPGNFKAKINNIPFELSHRPKWTDIGIFRPTINYSPGNTIKKDKIITSLPNETENIYFFSNGEKINIYSTSIIYDKWLKMPMSPRMINISGKSSNEIKHGDSGSPIFNSNNKLIGMLISYEDGEVKILPAIYLMRVLQKSNEENEMINGIPISYNLVDENIMINKVYSKETGLIEGTILTKIDTSNIVNGEIYLRAVRRFIAVDIFLILYGKENTFTWKKQISGTKQFMTGETMVTMSNINRHLKFPFGDSKYTYNMEWLKERMGLSGIELKDNIILESS